MNLTISNFESLRKFLVCYFHEDFLLEYQNPDEALDDFVNCESSEEIDKVVVDLERILSVHPENREVRELLITAHCAYDPRADGITETGWLQHIHAKLKESLN